MKYIKLFEEAPYKEISSEEAAMEELLNTKAIVGFYYLGLFIKKEDEIKELIEKYNTMNKDSFKEYFIDEYKSKLKKKNKEENTKPNINVILYTNIGIFNVGFSIEDHKINFVNNNIYKETKEFSKDYINSESIKPIKIGKISEDDKEIYREVYKIINIFFKENYTYSKFIDHLDLNVTFKW
jgi:hypothetical protein